LKGLFVNDQGASSVAQFRARLGLAEGDSAPSAAPAEQMTWYFSKDGQSYGPFTQSDLLERFGKGELGAECYVWTQSYDEWLPAYETPPFSLAIQESMIAAYSDDDDGERTVVSGSVPAVDPNASPEERRLEEALGGDDLGAIDLDVDGASRVMGIAELQAAAHANPPRPSADEVEIDLDVDEASRVVSIADLMAQSQQEQAISNLPADYDTSAGTGERSMLIHIDHLRQHNAQSRRKQIIAVLALVVVLLGVGLYFAMRDESQISKELNATAAQEAAEEARTKEILQAKEFDTPESVGFSSDDLKVEARIADLEAVDENAFKDDVMDDEIVIEDGSTDPTPEPSKPKRNDKTKKTPKDKKVAKANPKDERKGRTRPKQPGEKDGKKPKNSGKKTKLDTSVARVDIGNVLEGTDGGKGRKKGLGIGDADGPKAMESKGSVGGGSRLGGPGASRRGRVNTRALAEKAGIEDGSKIKGKKRKAGSLTSKERKKLSPGIKKVSRSVFDCGRRHQINGHAGILPSKVQILFKVSRKGGTPSKIKVIPPKGRNKLPKKFQACIIGESKTKWQFPALGGEGHVVLKQRFLIGR